MKNNHLNYYIKQQEGIKNHKFYDEKYPIIFNKK